MRPSAMEDAVGNPPRKSRYGKLGDQFGEAHPGDAEGRATLGREAEGELIRRRATGAHDQQRRRDVPCE